jgi:hypothetical protein
MEEKPQTSVFGNLENHPFSHLLEAFLISTLGGVRIISNRSGILLGKAASKMNNIPISHVLLLL